MKPAQSLFSIIALAFSVSFAQAATIVAENFDDVSTWNSTPSPAFGTFQTSTDVWEPVASLSNITTLDNNFLGARDLNNNDNVGGDVSLTFDNVSIDGFSDLNVSFDWQIHLWDTGDLASYEIVIDGSGQGPVDFGIGGVGGVSNSGTVSVAVAATSAVGLILTATQDGGSDYAGFDNFILSGTPIVIPEPSAASLVMLLGLGAFTRRRRA